LSKHGPKYLRWGLIEAAIDAGTHHLYRQRYQNTKRRLGPQRGAKVAQIDLARKLAEAIWRMLTKNQPFDPSFPTAACPRPRRRSFWDMRPRSEHRSHLVLDVDEAIER
jgi:hypothetical protein